MVNNVYWVLFTGVKLPWCFCHLSIMNILQQQLFILHSNLSDKKPNSELIATQIGPDTVNSAHFT